MHCISFTYVSTRANTLATSKKASQRELIDMEASLLSKSRTDFVLDAVSGSGRSVAGPVFVSD